MLARNMGLRVPERKVNGGSSTAARGFAREGVRRGSRSLSGARGVGERGAARLVAGWFRVYRAHAANVPIQPNPDPESMKSPVFPARFAVRRSGISRGALIMAALLCAAACGGGGQAKADESPPPVGV